MDPAITQPLIYGAILALFAFLIDRRDAGRHRELTERLDRSEERTTAEFARVWDEFGHIRGELAQIRNEFTQVRAELAALRSDLTQVALAVRAYPHPQTG